MFKNRHEAGGMLAEKLGAYRGADAVVLGLPRGGVVLSAEIAHRLNLPQDIAVARKIGHPGNPEYAIGVVDAGGEAILNEAEAGSVDPQWLADETERQIAEAKRRVDVYRGGRPPAALAGKTVIIVDDGIATGLTMRLAVRSVKKQHPARIIVAVPVAPEDAEPALHDEGADELVTLLPPEEFLGAVGAHYSFFPQTTDGEVIALLQAP